MTRGAEKGRNHSDSDVPVRAEKAVMVPRNQPWVHLTSTSFPTAASGFWSTRAFFSDCVRPSH